MNSEKRRPIAYEHGYADGRDEALSKVEPKRGEWIDDGPYIRCFVCGFSCDDEYYLAEKRYCPNCGAKMEVQDGK